MKKKEPVYVIFGAGEKPNKAIVGIRRKDSKGAGVVICEMENDGKYDFGSKDLSQRDLTGAYAVLWFCKKKSLEGMISCLNELREEMVDDLEGVAYGMKRRDVKPMVRGKWISHDFVSMGNGRYTGSVECSVCHRFLPMNENFCPSCGADCRGDNDG